MHVLQDIWLEQDDAQLLHAEEEVTLMDWGNAVIKTIKHGADGQKITGRVLLPSCCCGLVGGASACAEQACSMLWCMSAFSCCMLSCRDVW